MESLANKMCSNTPRKSGADGQGDGPLVSGSVHETAAVFMNFTSYAFLLGFVSQVF
tara:strand:- start:313 stop:480 length:168 start_codon:yes stop_codon:yes gene_type:complete